MVDHADDPEKNPEQWLIQYRAELARLKHALDVAFAGSMQRRNMESRRYFLRSLDRYSGRFPHKPAHNPIHNQFVCFTVPYDAFGAIRSLVSC